MPTISASPMFFGPTIDADLERATPMYRQEPFQLTAGRHAPIQIKTTPRPKTTQVRHDLHAGATTVLTRSGNHNPDQAGEGPTTSIWGISDPYGQSHLGAEGGVPMTKLVLVGALLGLGAWLLGKRS